MTWQPVLLFAFAGFLVGGVAATWRNSRLIAAVLAALALALAGGGVLWLASA